MLYKETIIKKNGVLKKYIPAPEGSEPPVALMIPEDVHTVAAACFAPEGTDIPENVAYEWDINFPVQVVILPETVKKIEPAAFMGLMTLKSFLVAGDCPAAELKDGILYSKDGKTVLCCPPCMEGDIVLADGTKVIEENAFEGSYLTSVVIPYGTEQIKDDNFSWSYDLEKVSVPSTVKRIGERCFSECDNLTVYAPAGSYAEEYARRNGIPFMEAGGGNE